MQIAVVGAGGKVLTRRNSVLSSESFKSLKPAPWVSALEAFVHGQGEEKQGL